MIESIQTSERETDFFDRKAESEEITRKMLTQCSRYKTL